MDVFTMTKEDFEAVPFANRSTRGCQNFHSLVIIPTKQKHDSGFMCMQFVAVDKDGNPLFKVDCGSDVLHIDGICGYGEWQTETPKTVIPKGWSLDCLPCGYLRLFCFGTLKIGNGISDFEIYGNYTRRK